MRLQHALVVAAATLLLAACGDSPQADMSEPPPAATREVPASATASPAAYTQFAATLPKSESDEPLDVRKVTPPTSESEAPLVF